MRLYTPKKWIGADSSVYDSSQQQQQYTQRREDTEIPENLGYKAKHEIGGDLIEEAVNSGLNFGCVLGDSNFGKSPALRRRLRKQSIPYALELVPSKFPVVNEETPLQEESESESPDPDETH
jgi:SRSO17 transposase